MSGLANPAAEWSVVATMIAEPSCIGEVVGTQLEASDYHRADARILHETVVEAFYADGVVDPIVVAERASRKGLAEAWSVPVSDLADELARRLKDRDYGKGVIDHAAIVKRHGTARKLLAVVDQASAAVREGVLTPEEVAGRLSSEALAVTSGTIARASLFDWMDTGREYARHMQRLRIARERGIEMAVYTGQPFIDEYTKGIAPTELCFIAGAPGVGKSVLGWKSAEGFALRQMKKAPEHRIGTLIVSMEMGLVPSATRLAQSITRIDGMRLREGDITDREYQYILREWKARDGLPIYFNYASNFRLSQLRALVVESIRRFNVGFVVIDHFRQLDPDRRIDNAIEADEEKARFLKEELAKDLNVAVMCLAHTVKLGGGADPNRRPRLADLRGSGQISAAADFVGFMHKPTKGMDDAEQMTLGVKETDAEMIWEKARHTQDGTAYFTFEPATMTVRPR